MRRVFLAFAVVLTLALTGCVELRETQRTFSTAAFEETNFDRKVPPDTTVTNVNFWLVPVFDLGNPPIQIGGTKQ